MEPKILEKISNRLKDAEKDMLALIERLVNIDSGSFYKEGIDACGRIIAEELAALGFSIQTIQEKERGDHIRADRSGKGSKRLLILAHLDTVCPSGTAAKRPFRVADGLAYGPGVGDIKSGIVQTLYALKVLREMGVDTPPVSVFLTGDEEIGSVRGRPHIEALARECSWVLVMEPSSSPDSVGVRRWGLGAFHLSIHGKAAHVLEPDSQGVNACRELALKILALESLSDTRRGVKVSVNLVHGGRSRQVTAAEAYAAIDVRVRDAALMESVDGQLRKVASTPILPGIRIELEGKLTRPPLEPNSGSEAFLHLASEVGRAMGITLNPIEEYGGSDGCFTAALGIPTLDGMGPMCYDMCGDNERIEVQSLIPRTTLLAGIIARLAEDKGGDR
jgi:glutamate carboxypeptidase